MSPFLPPKTLSLEVNQLLLSGYVTSQVKIYPFGETGRKAVFTLQNSWGRFYVQWNYAIWQPSQGDYVMLRGLVFSMQIQGSDTGRIQADEIYLLKRE